MRGFLVALFACACVYKFPVPSTTAVRCATDSECPAGFVCKATLTLCVAANASFTHVGWKNGERSASRSASIVAEGESDGALSSARVLDGATRAVLKDVLASVQSKSDGSFTVSIDLSGFSSAQSIVLEVSSADGSTSETPTLTLQ